MTIAELRNMSDQEQNALFSSMPEPSYKKPINTAIDRMDQIIQDYSKSKISGEDREALRDDLNNLA